jgi:hypothetical protein
METLAVAVSFLGEIFGKISHALGYWGSSRRNRHLIPRGKLRNQIK